jgi:hypothetical protein
MGTTRRKPGSLGPYVEGYSAWLMRRGHTALTTRNMLKEFGQVGRWLGVKHMDVWLLSEPQLIRFLADQRRAGYRKLPGLRGLRVPLAYLREVARSLRRHHRAPRLMCCSSSTGSGWSSTVVWPRRQCCDI